MTEDEYRRNLKDVALRLMAEDPTYFGTFPVDVLISFLEDRTTDHRVLCAYCKTPLLENSLYSFNGTADHLLPQKHYPHLQFDKANGNSVACCARCNACKGAWDPNKEGDAVYDDQKHGGVLTKEQRQTLIDRSVIYLEKRLGKRYAAWKAWEKACQQLDDVKSQLEF